MLVLSVWTLAMLTGLCWRRGAAVGLSAATVLAWLLNAHPPLTHPMGWIQLAAFGGMPWWVATHRARFDRRLKRLLNAEAMKLSGLKEHHQRLLGLKTTTQQLESQIAQITDLYHVTKQTAKALHVDELFRRSLEAMPRLLALRGLRLIDLEGTPENPVVLRAVRHDQQPLTMEPPGSLSPFERTILDEVRQTGQAGAASRPAPGDPRGGAGDQGLESWPSDLSTVAWAPLWSPAGESLGCARDPSPRDPEQVEGPTVPLVTPAGRDEQRPMGVLIADGLPADQTKTLSIVANQLSLQLARVRFYQAVESMAVTDSLTGLFVRRYFLELAVEELQRSGRHELSCACLLVDLDEFKRKNDTYGHLTGDVVLREVAQLLRRHLREVDLIARLGGEEFVLLLIETGAEHAMAIAQRFRQLVELHPIRAYDEVLRQTISMGVAIFPDDGKELQQLIDRADQALYAAKRAGRNRVIHWSSSLI